MGVPSIPVERGGEDWGPLIQPMPLRPSPAPHLEAFVRNDSRVAEAEDGAWINDPSLDLVNDAKKLSDTLLYIRDLLASTGTSLRTTHPSLSDTARVKLAISMCNEHVAKLSLSINTLELMGMNRLDWKMRVKIRKGKVILSALSFLSHNYQLPELPSVLGLMFPHEEERKNLPSQLLVDALRIVIGRMSDYTYVVNAFDPDPNPVVIQEDVKCLQKLVTQLERFRGLNTDSKSALTMGQQWLREEWVSKALTLPRRTR
ncbi:hypothetical protein T439DRAFT_55323 [Meredithblackwellia eburnea MCA 4105]